MLACLQPLVHAQSGYPNRLVRIVAPSAAGSAADTVARVIAPLLSERIGQPVFVDTRPGAGDDPRHRGCGEVAARWPYAADRPAGAHASMPSIYKTLPYDGLRDFAAITQAVTQPNLFVVHPSLPVKNMKDLIALAKARPGELSYGLRRHRCRRRT